MRKLINVILIIASIVTIFSSCNTSKRISNEIYVGEGYGESFDKNIAHEKAYLNAVSDICRKYNITVNSTYSQTYSSNNGVGIKDNESLTYDEHTNAKSSVNANDIIEEVKFTNKGRIWCCNSSVKVSKMNLK